jgi:FdhE protein
VRQGETAPKGAWTGSAIGGVKAPEPIILPDPAARFGAAARRLGRLAEGHPMEGWLYFMAEVAEAQRAAAAALPPLAGVDEAQVRIAVEARLPPIAADGWRREPVWRDALRLLIDRFDAATLPPAAATVIADLRDGGAEATEALADSFLRGLLDPSDAGAAFWIAAALQVYFTRLAAGLRADSLRLLEQRGLCPCCGSTPSAGVVRASGPTPGARYLYCSLCSTAWNHARAICITCGGSRTLTLHCIDGDAGVVKAETCDECRTYAKMLYEAKDPAADPYADDLASLALDVMVSEAGWARHAPNPLLLVG